MRPKPSARLVIPAIESRRAEVQELCRRHQVARLDLFGSAAAGRRHSPESDLDFLVEFQPAALDAYADAYFGLLESLQQLFGRPIDLVIDSSIDNPYFRQSVEQTRTRVYEA